MDLPAWNHPDVLMAYRMSLADKVPDLAMENLDVSYQWKTGIAGRVSSPSDPRGYEPAKVQPQDAGGKGCEDDAVI